MDTPILLVNHQTNQVLWLEPVTFDNHLESLAPLPVLLRAQDEVEHERSSLE